MGNENSKNNTNQRENDIINRNNMSNKLFIQNESNIIKASQRINECMIKISPLEDMDSNKNLAKSVCKIKIEFIKEKKNRNY